MMFFLAKMTIKTGLDLAKSLPAYDTDTDRPVQSPSLRTFCFYTANVFREAGYPDWVQLTSLVHALGQLVHSLETEIAASPSGVHDGNIPSRTRSTSSPSSTQTASRDDCNYGRDEPTKSSLVWTDTEYMYEMLKHNETFLPDEALPMVRCSSFDAWEGDLRTRFDAELLPVTGYIDMLRKAEDLCRFENEMADDECEALWASHYSSIAAKYGLDGDLAW
jgi:hypothetical protein